MKQSETNIQRIILRATAGGRVSPQGWFQGDCPFCHGKMKLGYHPEIGRYCCFKCGARGFIGHSDDTTFRPRGLPEMKCHLLGEERPSIEPPEGFISFEDYHKGRPSYYGRTSWQYALGRGLTAEALLQSGAGFIGRHGPWAFQQRLVFPILDTNQRNWLGYVGRRINGPPNDPYKYLYNKGFDRQTTLYNSRTVITPSTTDPIWVVEGAPDALYFHPHGTAVLGTYTPYQLYLLMQCKDRPVIVVMDGDAHQIGYNFAVALHDLGVWAGCIKLPSRKDPDNMKYDWLYEEAMRSLTIGLF